ncbi:hypothetical protein BKA70DRAFT_1418910 [Coprinopsis sp. MPI-PUGE-AT-0042]|nr:hypothetical protein BKA70DRAFT_1418910 [Coprinopsis sp. MPI-PUGE-AT-0042]
MPQTHPSNPAPVTEHTLHALESSTNLLVPPSTLPSADCDTMNPSSCLEVQVEGGEHEEPVRSVEHASEAEVLRNQAGKGIDSPQGAQGDMHMDESEERDQDIELGVGCLNLFRVLRIFRRRTGGRRTKRRKAAASKQESLFPIESVLPAAIIAANEETSVASLAPQVQDISPTSSVSRKSAGQEPPITPNPQASTSDPERVEIPLLPRDQGVPATFSSTGTLFPGAREVNVSGGGLYAAGTITFVQNIYLQVVSPAP